jgi:pimeloyl-ACP methyl ester carboxylesterase
MEGWPVKAVLLILRWGLALFLLSLFVLALYSRHWLASAIVLMSAALVLPPVRAWIAAALRPRFPAWALDVLVPVLFVLFVFVIFKGMGNKHSIYKTPEIEARLMAIYDARMREWPVPFESRDLNTEYGRVHVIISGPPDAPPLFLLHASAMGSWSWLYNVEGLAARYRTYALDTIGDAGESVLTNVNHAPADGRALARLYAEIMDKLGVERASFAGASQGGFIAANLALHRPERVDKLVLCGPMGLGGTNSSVLRILVTTMFPINFLHESTLRWAFGEDPEVRQAIDEWFRLILEGVISRQPRPRPFSPTELGKLRGPVLLLLGRRDGLVGNPGNSMRAARHIPDVRIELLDTGHLISAEKPGEFNSLVLDFLAAE